jgi:hypothetical protein
MWLNAKTLEDISQLPDEGLDLDAQHVAGILARYNMARQRLCGLLAQKQESEVEALHLSALQASVEKDIPALLREISKSATQI